MKRLPLPLFIGVVMLITFSCQETQVASLQTEPSTIRLVDGRISFPSQEAFRATVQELAKDQEHLDKFDTRFSGYVSMRAAYDQLTDVDAEKIVSKTAGKKYDNFTVEVGEGEDREITRVIGDPILATLVNADGWLQIGKELFKFKRDKFFVLENTSQARMAQVETGLVVSPDVKVGRVTRSLRNALPNARVAADIHCLKEYWVGWSGLAAHRTCKFCVVLSFKLFRAFVTQRRVLPHPIVIRLNVLENLGPRIIYI